MGNINAVISNLQKSLYAMMIVCNVGCTEKHWIRLSGDGRASPEVSISDQYNKFEGGILFQNVHQGLDILWEASFNRSTPFKEHLALFIKDGVLICPNNSNTLRSASLSSLPGKVEENKFLVLFKGEYREVLGIIHTHIAGVSTPTPRNDFQFAYLGIHNYVMSYHDLYDAYKDARGREITKRLGRRWAYAKLPFDGLCHGLVAKE